MPVLLTQQTQEDETTAEVLATLPRPIASAVRRALAVPAEQRFSVAFAALNGCGFGEAMRRTLAGKAVEMAAVLLEEGEGN